MFSFSPTSGTWSAQAFHCPLLPGKIFLVTQDIPSTFWTVRGPMVRALTYWHVEALYLPGSNAYWFVSSQLPLSCRAFLCRRCRLHVISSVFRWGGKVLRCHASYQHCSWNVMPSLLLHKTSSTRKSIPMKKYRNVFILCSAHHVF